MSAGSLPVGANLDRNTLDRDFRLYAGAFDPVAGVFRGLVPCQLQQDLLVKGPVDLAVDRLTPLAVFSASGLSLPVLHIQAIRLTREIRAGHWLRQFSAQFDRRLQSLHELSAHFADSLAEFTVNDHTVRGRATVTVWGDSLFLLSTYISELLYPAWSERLGAVVSSFRPRGTPAHPTIEPRTSVALGMRAVFQHPASWRREGDPADQATVLPVTLLNVDDDLTTNGLFQAVSSEASSDLVAEAVSRHEHRGFRTGEIQREAILPHHSSEFESATLTIFTGSFTPGGVGHECWVCVARAANFSIVLSLLTPARDESFNVWAINKRAFEIALETLRPLTPPATPPPVH